MNQPRIIYKKGAIAIICSAPPLTATYEQRIEYAALLGLATALIRTTTTVTTDQYVLRTLEEYMEKWGVDADTD